MIISLTAPKFVPGTQLPSFSSMIYVKFGAYLALLLMVGVICIQRFKDLQRAETFIAILIWATFCAEGAATFQTLLRRNSQPIYHVFSPIEFMLMCLYFNYSIRFFRRHKIGWFLGIAGTLLAVLNTLFLQKATTINSYFLIIEGATIISCCFALFHQILLDEEELPYRFASFWFTVCFCFFWGTTFTGWGISSLLSKTDTELNNLVSAVFTASNYIYYSGLALIFYQYKKLIPSGA